MKTRTEIIRGVALGVSIILILSLCSCLEIEVKQPTAIERSAKVAVLPFCATSPLHDNQFTDEELVGAREEFRAMLHRLFVERLSRELQVIHPKQVRKAIKEKGLSDVKDITRDHALIVARAAGADIAVWGQIKVAPHLEESWLGIHRRCDFVAKVQFIDVWNKELLAEVEISGKREELENEFSKVIKKLNFHPHKAGKW